MEERRPDPEALLERLREDERTARGRLKVFFGAAPGVGKTYAMLEAARRKKAEGVDVVVGWVETHGRAETAALLEGIERISPRALEYRGIRLHEFDLDAAVARRPALLLLDELAHTNAAGSRHAKRWQDAEELLDAGIDVWTTLNVQHLESLNDLVARITDVPVRETVPDRLLEGADEVELVDLPPDDLLQRLREGKVYVPEQAQRAIERFFRKGNLFALRELALRRTADHVDEDVRDYRRAHAIAETWPVTERLLVCIRPNPDSGRLIRAARRLASRLHAEWIVGYVESPDQPSLSDQDRHALAAAFKLAEQLGAETATLGGDSVAGAVLAYARAHNVSHIVVGKPLRPRWRDRFLPSPVDAIVRGSGEIDVSVISGEDAGEEKHAFVPPRRSRLPGAQAPWAVGVTLLATVLCWLMFPYFDRSNLIMVYLLGVAFLATRFGRLPAVIATCLSVAAFDFCFVPPYLTFAVSDTEYLVTFAVMLGVALLISHLAVRVRNQAEAALQREQRTRVLYASGRELAALDAPAEIARTAARRIADVFHGPAWVLLPGHEGGLVAYGPGADGGAAPRDRAVADWVFRHGRNAGLGTDTLPGAGALYVPLSGRTERQGVVGLRPREDLRPLTPESLDLLEALARQIGAALERVQLATAAEQARVEIEGERLRSTLLSSVSHDLRTPLASIVGAASMLVEDRALPEPTRRELSQTIHEEASHLNRLLTNLLDMTRLGSGSVKLDLQWHSLEEIVGAALAQLERPLEGHPVETTLAVGLPLIKVDAVLLERVLVNLLDNATKHTPPGTPIRVAAWREGSVVRVEVADGGPGLPPGEELRIFDRFYQRSPQSTRGFGLGLAISRAVVVAHGGRIWAENRPPRGVAFSFTIPVETPPPVPAEAAEADEAGE